jgi:hypothetical protein
MLLILSYILYSQYPPLDQLPTGLCNALSLILVFLAIIISFIIKMMRAVDWWQKLPPEDKMKPTPGE